MTWTETDSTGRSVSRPVYVERRSRSIMHWFGGPPSRMDRIRWWVVRHLMPWRRISG